VCLEVLFFFSFLKVTMFFLPASLGSFPAGGDARLAVGWNDQGPSSVSLRSWADFLPSV